ncbi:MAG: hypothetical protein WBA89_04115 [Microcoleus sp.]
MTLFYDSDATGNNINRDRALDNSTSSIAQPTRVPTVGSASP